jgi:N-acyl-D-aspartate/D-glutamate deacylase
MKKRSTLGLLVMLTLAACGGRGESFDVLLLGGTVVDGTGGETRRADVGLRGGRIAAIEDDLGEAQATDVIDVTGLVVAPGFIDAHSHADEGLVDPELRDNAGFLTQGVTTSVFGVDGGPSPDRIRELVGIFEEQGVGTNYAFFVGHNGVRRQIMGMENRRATPEETAAMQALVEEGMEMGAFGLSTGLMYLPGNFANTAEVKALSMVASAWGGVYDSHIRDPAGRLVDSIAEALEIGADTEIHAHPAHHKAPGRRNFGKSVEISALIEQAIRGGQAVTVDQYPYDGAATAKLIEVLVAPPDLDIAQIQARFVQAQSEEERSAVLDEGAAAWTRALADPEVRERVRELTEAPPPETYSWVKTVGYESFRLVASDAHPDWIGEMIPDLAEREGLSPFELIVRLIEEDGAVAKITLGACLEDDVRFIMTRPWTMIASDGAITGFEGGGGHPRSRGTFPRVLGRYVREWGVLGLEEAVHKMSGLPASYLGLRDRGVLREGNAADVTVFDPDTVIDRSTWREPALFSEGVEHVLVNGVFALRDGEVTGALAGTFLRHRKPPEP